MKPRLELAKAVIREGEKYLLLKRSPDAKVYPDRWDFPGGKLDQGETAEEAVVREVKEETGLDVAFGPRIKQTEYEDTDYILVFYYFIPQSLSGNIRLSDAHSEYQWFAEKEIRDLTCHWSITEFFTQI